ncbi:MAG: ribonuclease HII [Candidatus Altiarchaeota archaeon]|nr:ribonuclease HII [Candidatus Altiarchaeota archaeon]
MSELSCGIDEAGRGPVIGPLVMGCVVLDDEGREELKRLNVRDSKKVAPSRRLALEPSIKEIAVEWSLVKITPLEIDLLRKKHSLNFIEAMKVAEMILGLRCIPHKIIIDSADTVPEEYKRKIIHCITSGNEDFVIPEIISEHKADDRYVEVSAASILAKVERDREIEKLRAIHGELGSGYPADELTKRFIHELMRRGELPDFVRKSWNTVDKSKQTTLFEF